MGLHHRQATADRIPAKIAASDTLNSSHPRLSTRTLLLFYMYAIFSSARRSIRVSTLENLVLLCLTFDSL